MHSLKNKTQEYIVISMCAITVGIVAVAYGRLFNFCEEFFFKIYSNNPIIFCLFIPLIFLTASATVHIFSPEAQGSGIPAVLEAIEQISHTTEHKIKNENLVSLKTSFIKIISSCFGVMGGMSLGMEGPMIQVAASIFSFASLKIKSSHINRQIYLIAGGAAGIAAAFNTPIGGVAFALEELIEGPCVSFKQTILFSVILAGFTAIALEGNYLYFQINPDNISPLGILSETLLIAFIAGFMGSLFSKIISLPLQIRLPGRWWIKALYLGIFFSILVYSTNTLVCGAGINVLKDEIKKSPKELLLFFPLWKMLGTLLSYFSGMAGGIFAPSLSMGAGIGLSIAKIGHFTNIKTCALLGMVAFFSASVQAPMTAFIIVAEMTSEHRLILPFMLCALIGQIMGKLLMPTPLYRFLFARYLK